MDNVFTFSYNNEEYDPAMPVVQIRLTNPGSHTVTLSAIVDSGSDATMIPKHFLQEIEAVFVRKGWVSGISGVRQQVNLYLVDVQIGSYIVPSIRVVETNNQREAILGRDVLNQLIIKLNGLAQVTEITA